MLNVWKSFRYLSYQAFSLLTHGQFAPPDSARLTGNVVEDDASGPTIVVYAATVGELTGGRAFIERLRQRFPKDNLVVLCGQETYLEAAAKLHPEARVGIAPAPGLVSKFMRRLRVRMVCLLEGPSLMGRFPIHMDTELVAYCGHHGVPVYVIQASMHETCLRGRRDRIEQALFSGLYRDAITAWYTPYEAFADALISAGARPDRVVVTGDMKFSNVLEASVAQPSSGLLRILDRYRQQQGPIIVGGSVNSVDETEAVVNGFSQVRQSHPDACLVLAPRHVHRPEMMKPVYEFLDASGYTVARRSQTPPEDLPVDILVIDVFGELMHFYELSTICYIGRNHGVLEPLRFDKPTVVATDEFWKTDYVTFPQYELMTRSGAILKADSPEKVGAIFLRLIDDRPFRDEVVACANRVCSQNLGAVDRVIAEISARDG